MTIDTYALIANGKVVNTIAWDGVSSYNPGDGVTMVPLPYTEEVDEDTGKIERNYQGGIGWDYVDGEFVDNRPVEEFDA